MESNHRTRQWGNLFIKGVHMLEKHIKCFSITFHSTETALLKIHNDNICNMDNGKVNALTLLDLSAAFDTIDHSTLLERLHVHFGISGTVFQWFKSYISNRQQRVHIDGSLSCPQDLHFGVPQGSVLGPFLFVYTQRQSVKWLTLTTSVIICMLMTHMFT